jgi:hypothetical protein
MFIPQGHKFRLSRQAAQQSFIERKENTTIKGAIRHP